MPIWDKPVVYSVHQALIVQMMTLEGIISFVHQEVSTLVTVNAKIVQLESTVLWLFQGIGQMVLTVLTVPIHQEERQNANFAHLVNLAPIRLLLWIATTVNTRLAATQHVLHALKITNVQKKSTLLHARSFSIQTMEKDFASLAQMVVTVVITEIPLSQLHKMQLLVMQVSTPEQSISCVYHALEVISAQHKLMEMVIRLVLLSHKYAQVVHMLMKSKLLALHVHQSITQNLVVHIVLQYLQDLRSIRHQMTSKHVHTSSTVIGDRLIVRIVLMVIYALRRRMI